MISQYKTDIHSLFNNYHKKRSMRDLQLISLSSHIWNQTELGHYVIIWERRVEKQCHCNNSICFDNYTSPLHVCDTEHLRPLTYGIVRRRSLWWSVLIGWWSTRRRSYWQGRMRSWWRGDRCARSQRGSRT